MPNTKTEHSGSIRLNQAQSGLFPFQQTRARKKSILPPSLSTVAT
jgi:hypothetical protein